MKKDGAGVSIGHKMQTREKKREKFVFWLFNSHSMLLKMQRNLRMKKELQMFVQSPPHGVSCWTNDEDNMTQLTARKDM